jgi:hypothetical protein
MMGGGVVVVEVNPGPISIKQEAEIFEFVKKDRGKGVRSKKEIMEAVEKSLAAMNSVITWQTVKMEEGNKAIKGLEEGSNNMKTELNKVKSRTKQMKIEKGGV